MFTHVLAFCDVINDLLMMLSWGIRSDFNCKALENLFGSFQFLYQIPMEKEIS